MKFFMCLLYKSSLPFFSHTAALFQVICTAELLADRSCINITCEVAEGSQIIVGVDFLINGESEGSGENIIKLYCLC